MRLLINTLINNENGLNYWELEKLKDPCKNILKSILTEVDIDLDGRINYEEFRTLII